MNTDTITEGNKLIAEFNDLKTHCGDKLTKEMYEVLENPRKPVY